MNSKKESDERAAQRVRRHQQFFGGVYGGLTRKDIDEFKLIYSKRQILPQPPKDDLWNMLLLFSVRLFLLSAAGFVLSAAGEAVVDVAIEYDNVWVAALFIGLQLGYFVFYAGFIVRDTLRAFGRVWKSMKQ